MKVPSRGFCHSVFLLTSAARLGDRSSLEDWVSAARRETTIMAQALAVDRAAEFLMEVGLSREIEGRIDLDQRLLDAGDEASTQTFASIARVLILEQPPDWIDLVVNDDIVRSEFIPANDADSLEWLGEFRDLLLVDIKNIRDRDNLFHGWLGSVGEAFVAESERGLGYEVTHVSKISDYFGYDIESRSPSGRRRIEVKTSLESRSDRFFITKNEFVKAREFGKEWFLVQVVLHQSASVAITIRQEHIIDVRFLTSPNLVSLAPSDTETGTWLESARIVPPQSDWRPWVIHPLPTWSFEGYRADKR